MSYPINQQFNPKQQQAMGFSTSQMPNVSTETVRQNINANPVVKTAKEENPVFLISLMLPLWAVLSKGMDKFNSACRNLDGKKNLLDKVSYWGDKAGELLGKSNSGKLRSDSIFEWIGDKLKLINNKFIKKFTILDCLVNNPTKPGSSMVKAVASGTLGELVQDAPTVFTKYASNGGKEYDLAKLKKLGFNSAQEFEKWKQSDMLNNVDDVISRCRKMPAAEDFVEFAASKDSSFMKRFFLRHMTEETYDKSLGRVSKFFGRKIYFSEMANKLEALKGINGQAAKTVTGKILTKSFLRLAEGMTNATAGGKLAILMQALCFAQSIGATVDAPKGDKFKTFMEQIVYNLSMYLLMPLGIGLMHHANGLKYLGMTHAQVEKYQKDVKALNKAVDEGKITQAEHELRLKELNLLGKGDTKINLQKDEWPKTIIKGLKNILYKPVRFIARNTLGIGLDAIKPFIDKNVKTIGGKIGNFMKMIPYRLRFGAGYPVRFIGYLFIVAPPLAALAVKLGPHMLFGRPKKSVIDKDKAEEKPLPPLVYPPQYTTAATAMATAAPYTESVMQNVQNNDLKENVMAQPQAKSFITTQARSEQAQRRYIPSSDGVKVTMVDPKEAKARNVLLASEKSERIARKQLG